MDRGGVNNNAILAWGWLVAVLVLASVEGSLGGRKGELDAASTHYRVLPVVKGTGQEQVLCLARGRCFLKTLRCPAQCTQRKPRRNRKVKACFVDCSSKCETTCKRRLPNCKGFGSVCYDPRFVGGDGVMFYFHGSKGHAFALVTDDHLQINAYFIGTRPHGRSRDFTWLQSLALLFRSHSLSVSAKRVGRWDDNTDVLVLTWNSQEIIIPTDGEAEWRTTTSDGDDGARLVLVERTDELNSIRITVQGVVEMDVKAVPVTEEDSRKHNYQIPADDAFAHLEAQFRFANLTDMVDGVLGRTYRPGYVSPVSLGVAMPTMGGEDKYAVETLYSADCDACRFRRPAEGVNDAVGAVSQL